MEPPPELSKLLWENVANKANCLFACKVQIHGDAVMEFAQPFRVRFVAAYFS
jgi:hypothetical protein